MSRSFMTDFGFARTVLAIALAVLLSHVSLLVILGKSSELTVGWSSFVSWVNNIGISMSQTEPPDVFAPSIQATQAPSTQAPSTQAPSTQAPDVIAPALANAYAVAQQPMAQQLAQQPTNQSLGNQFTNLLPSQIPQYAPSTQTPYQTSYQTPPTLGSHGPGFPQSPWYQINSPSNGPSNGPSNALSMNPSMNPSTSLPYPAALPSNDSGSPYSTTGGWAGYSDGGELLDGSLRTIAGGTWPGGAPPASSSSEPYQTLPRVDIPKPMNVAQQKSNPVFNYYF